MACLCLTSVAFIRWPSSFFAFCNFRPIRNTQMLLYDKIKRDNIPCFAKIVIIIMWFPIISILNNNPCRIRFGSSNCVIAVLALTTAAARLGIDFSGPDRYWRANWGRGFDRIKYIPVEGSIESNILWSEVRSNQIYYGPRFDRIKYIMVWGSIESNIFHFLSIIDSSIHKTVIVSPAMRQR